MSKIRKCTCKDWHKWMPFIDTALLLQWEHGGKLPKEYVFWKFCPWCGKPLEEMEEHD